MIEDGLTSSEEPDMDPKPLMSQTDYESKPTTSSSAKSEHIVLVAQSEYQPALVAQSEYSSIEETPKREETPKQQLKHTASSYLKVEKPRPFLMEFAELKEFTRPVTPPKKEKKLKKTKESKFERFTSDNKIVLQKGERIVLDEGV
jgi:hypothetical protein